MNYASVHCACISIFLVLIIPLPLILKCGVQCVRGSRGSLADTLVCRPRHSHHPPPPLSGVLLSLIASPPPILSILTAQTTTVCFPHCPHHHYLPLSSSYLSTILQIPTLTLNAGLPPSPVSLLSSVQTIPTISQQASPSFRSPPLIFWLSYPATFTSIPPTFRSNSFHHSSSLITLSLCRYLLSSTSLFSLPLSALSLPRATRPLPGQIPRSFRGVVFCSPQPTDVMNGCAGRITGLKTHGSRTHQPEAQSKSHLYYPPERVRTLWLNLRLRSIDG